MLHLSFAGTLGADPETRTAGQSEVTEFRVAVNGYDRAAKKKTTTWLKVNIWGKRGEQLANLCAKGDKVAGAGSFEVEEYTTRDGTKRNTLKVTAQDLSLQGGKRDRDEEPPPARGRKPPKQESFPDTDDDDIPF
jgi:single-strand DNA-binding protein